MNLDIDYFNTSTQNYNKILKPKPMYETEDNYCAEYADYEENFDYTNLYHYNISSNIEELDIQYVDLNKLRLRHIIERKVVNVYDCDQLLFSVQFDGVMSDDHNKHHKWQYEKDGCKTASSALGVGKYLSENWLPSKSGYVFVKIVQNFGYTPSDKQVGVFRVTLHKNMKSLSF